MTQSWISRLSSRTRPGPRSRAPSTTRETTCIPAQPPTRQWPTASTSGCFGLPRNDRRLGRIATRRPDPMAVTVFGEGRMVGHVALQAEAAEPPVGQVQMDLLTQPPLRPDAEAVADDQHADQQLGIDRRPAR